MALEFVGDAISLSGLTGSKLKSQIISQYYPFWWNITSGGPSNNFTWDTAIIELNAATGEMYIKDTKEIALGSAGHAMDLKCKNTYTNNLKIILVEEDGDCYGRLKNVINRRWPRINTAISEGPLQHNDSNIFLFKEPLDRVIDLLERIRLGNSLFFFDPLRSVSYQKIEKVASRRIKRYFQTGTEFIIFVFTSDWFLGRDGFVGLPTTTNESEWSESENNTVTEADDLFGNKHWRTLILNDNPIYEREQAFIGLYRQVLHKWFRYVLPMPFNPKDNQVYHLILCSNYETGVRATRGFFCDITRNPDYKPNNRQALTYFQARHSDLFENIGGNRKPKQWQILWRTIANHEEGICDCMCRDVEGIEKNVEERVKLIDWLVSAGYFKVCSNDNPWNASTTQHIVDWEVVKRLLGVNPPRDLEPLSLRPTSLWELSQ